MVAYFVVNIAFSNHPSMLSLKTKEKKCLPSPNFPLGSAFRIKWKTKQNKTKQQKKTKQNKKFMEVKSRSTSISMVFHGLKPKRRRRHAAQWELHPGARGGGTHIFGRTGCAALMGRFFTRNP